MGVETNVASGTNCGSPENPIVSSIRSATTGPFAAVTVLSLASLPTTTAISNDNGSFPLRIATSGSDPEDYEHTAQSSSSLSLSNLHSRLAAENTLSFFSSTVAATTEPSSPPLDQSSLYVKRSYSNDDDDDDEEKNENGSGDHEGGAEYAASVTNKGFSSFVTTASLYSESGSATNSSKLYDTPKSAGPISLSSSYADDMATTVSSSGTGTGKHFRFSGDFSEFRNYHTGMRSMQNTQLLTPFTSSSMGNLSNARDICDDEVTSHNLLGRISVKAMPPPQLTTPTSSNNSVLADLPTRFSFESSSTTSSSHSSSHLSSARRKFYQRNGNGSFERKDLQSSVYFQSQCTDYILPSTNVRYGGSAEKILTLERQRPDEELAKETATDISSLSLSPINRRRDLTVRGSSISR